MIACTKIAQPSARCVSLLTRSAVRPLVAARQEPTNTNIAAYSGISSIHIASKPSVSSIANQIRSIQVRLLLIVKEVSLVNIIKLPFVKLKIFVMIIYHSRY